MNEEHHQLKAFEAELGRFQPAPAPETMREEILGNACPGEPVRAGTKDGTRKGRPLLRLYAGTLAAAWLLILGFWLATPREARSDAYAEADLNTPQRPRKSHPPLPHPHGDMSQPPRAYMATVCQINHILGESH